MKLIFGIIGAACLAVAYYLLAYPQNDVDSMFFGIAVMVAVLCFGIAIWPTMRSKSIACCSLPLVEKLLDAGIDKTRISCINKGDFNYAQLTVNMKAYAFVLYDANETDGQMAINEIFDAVEAQKMGANVVVRLDVSSYATQSTPVDRGGQIRRMLENNGLKYVSTSELQTLITRYYAKKG